MQECTSTRVLWHSRVGMDVWVGVYMLLPFMYYLFFLTLLLIHLLIYTWTFSQLRNKEKLASDRVAESNKELVELNKKIFDFEKKLTFYKAELRAKKQQKRSLELQLARTFVTMEGLVDSVRTHCDQVSPSLSCMHISCLTSYTFSCLLCIRLCSFFVRGIDYSQVRSKKGNVQRNLQLINGKMTSFMMAQERGYTSQSHRLSSEEQKPKVFSLKPSTPAGNISTDSYVKRMQEAEEAKKFHRNPLTERKQPVFSSTMRIGELSTPLPRMLGHKSFKSETIQSLAKQLFEDNNRIAALQAAKAKQAALMWKWEKYSSVFSIWSKQIWFLSTIYTCIHLFIYVEMCPCPCRHSCPSSRTIGELLASQISQELVMPPFRSYWLCPRQSFMWSIFWTETTLKWVLIQFSYINSSWPQTLQIRNSRVDMLCQP